MGFPNGPAATTSSRSSALNVPSVIFPGSGMSAVSYHSFMDGVMLFFMTSVSTAAYVWVKKQFD